MRPLLLLAAAAALMPAAEIVRRDLQFALGTAPGDFDYTIDSPGGSFSGSDAFDLALQARLGARWALTAPGWSIAPVVGADLLYRDASYGSGGGLTGLGAGISAGVAWAITDRWSTDLELALAYERASLTLGDGSGLSGSGSLTGTALRARCVRLFDRTWSGGIEVGWQADSASIAADRGRDITLDIGGWTAAAVVIWRASMRPAGLE